MVQKISTQRMFVLCLLYLSIPLSGQIGMNETNDPCAQLPVPEFANDEKKKVLKIREKLNCDKIYQNRKKEFGLKQRFFELGAQADLTSLDTLVHLIALKEKVLCVYYKAIPEITEDFRRCRERQIDQWEKEIIQIVMENRKREKELREGMRPVKFFPEEAELKLKSELAQNLIEALQRIHSDGIRFGEQMMEYELKLWEQQIRK